MKKFTVIKTTTRVETWEVLAENKHDALERIKNDDTTKGNIVGGYDLPDDVEWESE